MPRPLILLAVVVAVATAVQPGSAAAPLVRVTFIGDSIPSAIAYDPASTRALSRGVEMNLELAVCRRLVDESCPYNGSRPPTLVDLLPTIQVGPVVIVGVGYNDYEQSFPDSVERSLAALRKAGVERVLWLTLRAERESYLTMNDVIKAAAERHPELTVVDWNLYSRSHPDWFQDDGLHLNNTGSLAMATLVHSALDTLGVVAAPALRKLTISPPTLPPAHVGRPYAARLGTGAATRPVRWRLATGSLPAGLRLQVDGRVTGTPRAAGRTTATFKATDARGRTGSRRLTIVVRPA